MKVTDKYGNIIKNIVGKKVTDGKFEFYVKEIKGDFAILDNSKPHKVLDKKTTMAKCVKSGNYAVNVMYLELIEESER